MTIGVASGDQLEGAGASTNQTNTNIHQQTTSPTVSAHPQDRDPEIGKSVRGVGTRQSPTLHAWSIQCVSNGPLDTHWIFLVLSLKASWGQFDVGILYSTHGVSRTSSPRTSSAMNLLPFCLLCSTHTPTPQPKGFLSNCDRYLPKWEQT